MQDEENRKRSHSGRLGQLGQASGAFVIDLARPLGVEVADRVVAQRREMDDRVEAVEVGGAQVANVLLRIAGTRTLSGTRVHGSK